MKKSEVMMCSEEDMEVQIVRDDQEGYGSMMEVKEEKYSPKMVLKVLLVESDDSTRQIIAALLHKCGYKVSAVSDGKMALEALKVHPHFIDLILTEVELSMSSISGLALLSSVMEKDVCKNIPVIMMSSHHSISMAIKCMSKGAADFLIKPVRKNELMNLWQHVWRRHYLSGDNMHLNGPIRQLKVEVTSVNHTGNYHSGDYVTTTEESKDCSGKKSEVQDLSELQCSRVSNWGDTSLRKNEEHVKSKKDSVAPASEIGGKFYRLGLGITPCIQAYKSTTFRPEDSHTCVEAMPQNESLGPDNYKTDSKPCDAAIDFIGAFDSPLMYTDQRSTFKHDMMEVEYAPHLELSLRRFCPGTLEGVVDTERNMLKPSNASNFSWYNITQSLKPFFPVLAKSSELKERANKPNQVLSNQVSQDTACSSQLYGSTRSNHKNVEQGEQSLKPELRSVPVSEREYDNFCAERRQVLTSTSCSDVLSSKPVCKQELYYSQLSTSVHANTNMQPSEQSDHRCNETGDEQSNIEPVKEQKPGSPNAEQSTCTSSYDCDASHQSRACGVTCKTDDNAATTLENFSPAESLNVHMNPFVYDGLKKMDPYRSSIREAALAKFRLKRKDRCYEKKVRYQSRKRLAEQRPRVKGQFVRRIDSDLVATTNHDPCQ